MISNNWQTTAKLRHPKQVGLHLQQLIPVEKPPQSIIQSSKYNKCPVGLDSMLAFPDHLNEKKQLSDLGLSIFKNQFVLQPDE